MNGCSTTPYAPTVAHDLPGVYHKVQKDQTLWRIAKAYGKSVHEIVKANRLPDASKISAGQQLFIPYVTAEIDVNSAGVGIEDIFVWPVKENVLSHYGFKVDGVKSKGITIQAARGEAVLASRDGVVNFADDAVKGFGRLLIVEHTDGFSTVYAHNSKNLVKVGDKVKRGTVIARVGDGGRADSPSLYFEIRKKHVPQNPFYYLP